MHIRLRASRPFVETWVWVGGSAVLERGETSATWDASTLGDDTVVFLDSRGARVGVNLLTGIGYFVYWAVVRPTAEASATQSQWPYVLWFSGTILTRRGGRNEW